MPHGRYYMAATGGPLRESRCCMAAVAYGRCGRGWADESEEEDAQSRRKQKLVFFNTIKTGNNASGGAVAATGKREQQNAQGRMHRQRGYREAPTWPSLATCRHRGLLGPPTG